MGSKRVTRKLRAILSADVQGYSRLMGDDEVATFKMITEYREIFSSIVTQYNGRVVDSPGDNILSEFASVVDAVQCAVEIQKVLKAKNEDLPENRKMTFRIGVNLGDVIHEDDRLYGDGVNIAARIESLADGGGICISGSAYEQIKNKLALGYNYLGEHSVKNISEPVHVYKVPMEPGDTRKGEKPKLAKNAAIAVAVVIVLVVAVIFWNSYLRTERIEPANLGKMAFPLPDKPSIAVLAFTNMSGDPNQDYLCDGISGQIIASLSKVPGIFVIARNSSFTYKGKPVKVQQVSEELGVQYVLEGSVQKSGDRLRITVQLIDAITGKHIWAEKYDSELENLFVLQDEIAMHILTALRVNLTEGEQARMFGEGTKNIDAYMKVMKGLRLYQNRTRGGTLKGIQLFEEAIALDPGYVNAYVLLGWAHCQLAFHGFTKSPAESSKKALELAQKAVVMDGSNANAHSLLGWLLAEKGQPEKAIIEVEKSLALDPNNSDIIAHFGYILSQAKRYDDAIAKFKTAIRLNPFPSDWYISLLINVYRLAGRYDDEAFSTMKWALGRDPDNFNALTWYSWNLGCAGRYTEAIETSKKAIRLAPKHPFYYEVFLGFNYFLAERYEEAIAPFKEAISKVPNNDKANLGLIATYNQLGRDEEARRIAETFLEGRPGYSAKTWFGQNSFKNPGDKERFAKAFQKFGLLEKGSASETSEKAVPLSLPDKPSIAVLPFANISGDPKEDYLSDGITEQVITTLSNTPRLFVIARNSVFTYKGKPVKVQKVSKDLGVRYVLEGSVQKSGDRIRITAQLIDARTGIHMWTEKFDRDLKNIFALQDEIAMNIMTALQVKLTEGEQARIYGRNTHNLEAYLKLFKGKEHLYLQNKRDSLEAKQMFEEAIALDPNYPTPYEFLAMTHLTDVGFGWSKSPGKSIEQAFDLSQKLLSIDSSSAGAHRVLSYLYSIKREYGKAISETEKAIDIQPSDADSYALLGLALSEMNQKKNAITALEKAIRLNPVSPSWYLMILGWAYLSTQQNDEASTAFERLAIRDSKHANALAGLGCSLIAVGKPEEAIAMFDKALSLNPQSPSWFIGNRAVALIGIGKPEEAITAMQDLVSRRPEDADAYRCFSTVLAFEGKHEEAFQMAKKAVSLRNWPIYRLRLGASYFNLKQYDQAIAELKKAVKLCPDCADAHVLLAAAYSLIGRMEDARAEVVEVLRINPKNSLEGIAKNGYYSTSSTIGKERFINVLRKAGLK